MLAKSFALQVVFSFCDEKMTIKLQGLMKRFYWTFAVVHIPKFVLWEATGNVGTPMVAPIH